MTTDLGIQPRWPRVHRVAWRPTYRKIVYMSIDLGASLEWLCGGSVQVGQRSWGCQHGWGTVNASRNRFGVVHASIHACRGCEQDQAWGHIWRKYLRVRICVAKRCRIEVSQAACTFKKTDRSWYRRGVSAMAHVIASDVILAPLQSAASPPRNSIHAIDTKHRNCTPFKHRLINPITHAPCFQKARTASSCHHPPVQSNRLYITQTSPRSLTADPPSSPSTDSHPPYRSPPYKTHKQTP